MPVTRFSYMSDTEFERELECRLQGGQLVLGTETARELMERIRRWVEVDEEELEILRGEVDSLERQLSDCEEDLKNA